MAKHCVTVDQYLLAFFFLVENFAGGGGGINNELVVCSCNIYLPFLIGFLLYMD